MAQCEICGATENLISTSAGTACQSDYPKLKRRKAQAEVVRMVTCSKCGSTVPPAFRCIRCGADLSSSGGGALQCL